MSNEKLREQVQHAGSVPPLCCYNIIGLILNPPSIDPACITQLVSSGFLVMCGDFLFHIYPFKVNFLFKINFLGSALVTNFIGITSKISRVGSRNRNI